MIRQVWFLTAQLIETFRTNWSLRQGERTDPRALAGDDLIAAAKQAWR